MKRPSSCIIWLLGLSLFACSSAVTPEQPVFDAGVPEIDFEGFGIYKIGMKLDAFLAYHQNPTLVSRTASLRHAASFQEISRVGGGELLGCAEVREFVLKPFHYSAQSFESLNLVFYHQELISISSQDLATLDYLQSEFGDGLEKPNAQPVACHVNRNPPQFLSTAVKSQASLHYLARNQWKHGDILIEANRSLTCANTNQEPAYSLSIKLRPAYGKAQECGIYPDAGKVVNLVPKPEPTISPSAR